MIDVDVVVRRLTALNEYVERLESRRNLTFEQLTGNWETYLAVQRLFHLAAQATVDIASHIVSADFAIQYDDYHGALIALGQAGVLPPEFARRGV